MHTKIKHLGYGGEVSICDPAESDLIYQLENGAVSLGAMPMPITRNTETVEIYFVGGGKIKLPTRMTLKLRSGELIEAGSLKAGQRVQAMKRTPFTGDIFVVTGVGINATAEKMLKVDFVREYGGLQKLSQEHFGKMTIEECVKRCEQISKADCSVGDDGFVYVTVACSKCGRVSRAIWGERRNSVCPHGCYEIVAALYLNEGGKPLTKKALVEKCATLGVEFDGNLNAVKKYIEETNHEVESISFLGGAECEMAHTERFVAVSDENGGAVFAQGGNYA